MSHETVDVEDLLGVEHLIEGASELVGEGRVRLGFAEPGRQAVQEGADALILLSGEDGGLGEGPLEPGVAGFLVADAAAFVVRRLDGAAQTGVGAELLPRVEASDGVDLQEDGEQRIGPTPGVDCKTASSVGKITWAASSISVSSRRIEASSGSSSVR